MRNYKSNSGSLIGVVISLSICAVSAILAGAFPSFNGWMGVVLMLSAIALAVCVSRFLTFSFKAKTGVALSEYMQRLYCGRRYESK